MASLHNNSTSKICCSIFILFLAITLYNYSKKPFKNISNIYPYYDYIIVGGGTAGCVIASKLSEIKDVNVLLIEAGGEFGFVSSIPIAPTLLQKGSNDWAFKTVPQKHSSFGLSNKIQFIPRGKGLGGTGNLNYFLHGVGVPDDYKLWTKMGAENWNYQDLKPFVDKSFMHAKCFEVDNKHTECTQKNYSQGVIRLSDNDLALKELTDYFIKAADELKMKAEPVIHTIFNGKRESTYHSHLKPYIYKHNLHIILNAQVTKINFQGTKANSVDIRSSNNQNRTIMALNEIILSCGAIQTPQLLMLSGIGPKTELLKHNIPIVAELDGVGKNLHDHLNMPLYISIKKPLSVTLTKIKSLESIYKYITAGTGYLSRSGVTAISRGANHTSVVLFALGSTDEFILREIANTKSETFRAFFPYYDKPDQEGIILLNSCLQPHSRGTVTLQDTNPQSSPLIDPMYLSDDIDINCMIASIRLTMQIVDSPIFKNIGALIHWPTIKVCLNLWTDNINDEYLKCITKYGALTGHHSAGTCSMAGNSSVVDSSLRVHNVSHLRIVDSSVLPTPISSSPNSIIVAIAEKAVELIKYSVK